MVVGPNKKVYYFEILTFSLSLSLSLRYRASLHTIEEEMTFLYSLSALLVLIVGVSTTSPNRVCVEPTCDEKCLSLCQTDNVCLNRCRGTTGEVEVDFKLANNRGFGNPVAIRFGRFPNDNPSMAQRMFIASQDGRLQYTQQSEFKNDALTTMLDLAPEISTTIDRTADYSEAGFLGFELHPGFNVNGRFFVWYTMPRENGTPSNTPNCSWDGEYGPSGPSNGRRNFGVDRPYDPDVYTSLVVLEEYKRVASGAATTFVRRLLTHKHFFVNHYGINNLMFEENGNLLVAVGDGGCFFDQFAVAQNRSFIAGKVISVEVDANPEFVPPFDNCSTPVALWSELSEACHSLSDIFSLYASGVRNMGHMSMDVYQGKINHYIAMIGQNRAEAIYRFDYEANFGWLRRENKGCTCLYDDPLIDTQCDFRQTIAECRNETSMTGAYVYPMATFNQRNDHVSSMVGGFVYRGRDLPCSMQGAYILGDWSTKDEHIPTFPGHHNGILQLFQVAVDSTGLSANGINNENAHGKIRVGRGLLYSKNYLASMGYDKETNRIYMGVQDIIPPYMADGNVSTRGQIYILTSPTQPLVNQDAPTVVCKNGCGNGRDGNQS